MVSAKLLLDATSDYDSALEKIFTCENEYTNTSCIRVVSWVVYYGHTRLLQYIAERVLSNNESISAIFGFYYTILQSVTDMYYT
jgi:hypothetical protein